MQFCWNIINYIRFLLIASYLDKYDLLRIHVMSYSVFDKDKIRSTSQNFPYPITKQCNDFLSPCIHYMPIIKELKKPSIICKPLLISFFYYHIYFIYIHSILYMWWRCYIFYFTIFWFCKDFMIHCQILIFKTFYTLNWDPKHKTKIYI